MNRTAGVPSRRRSDWLGHRALRYKLASALVVLAMSLIAIAVLVPIAYAVNLSLIGVDGLRSGAVLALPPSFESLLMVWSRSGMPLSFINSLIYTGGTVALLWLVGSMAAYAGTKIHMRGRSVVLFGIILFLAMPLQTILYPLFAHARDLGLVNERYGVILVMAAFGLPLTVFQFAAFFKSLPSEVVEAARIDGASAWQVLLRVILPMSTPVLALTGVWNAIWTWNALLLPLILLTRRDHQTMIVTLAQLQGESGLTTADSAASAVLGMIPMLVFFLIAQRAIIKGVASGAVRG